jgi:Tfp pilus assembly protein PilX
MPGLSAIGRRLRREDGVALVVAIGVLLVMGIIAAGVATLTVTAKNQTNADRNSSRALAAAESGLRLATLYLNEATPIVDGQCPGTTANLVATKTAAVSGSCGPYTATLPSGGTTTFTISAGATTAVACSGAQVNAPTRPSLAIHQRCVTSTGQVNPGLPNVATRRVQARLASVSYIFPIPGILGTHNVKLGQGAGSQLPLTQCAVPSSLPGGTSLIMASVGTNGTLTTSLGCWLGAATDVTNGNTSRLYIGSNAPTTNNGVPNPSITGAQPGGIVNLTYPLTLPSLDPLFQTGMDGVTDTSIAATSVNVLSGNNDNFGIHAVPLTCNGNPYDSTTRVLNLGNNACSVTLDGSTDINHPNIYNFCGLVLPNNGLLTVTNPAVAPYVQVYVDSTARTRLDGTAACTSGSGTVTMGNNSSILNNATVSLGAQIFIYGTSDPDGTLGNSIAWRNGADVKMLLVAPHAQILFQNGGTITGGIAAYDVTANNSMIFIWDQTVDSVQRRALYYRSSYTECAKAPTVAGNPDSGC